MTNINNMNQPASSPLNSFRKSKVSTPPPLDDAAAVKDNQVRSGDKVVVSQPLGNGQYKTYMLNADQELITAFLIGKRPGDVLVRSNTLFKIIRIINGSDLDNDHIKRSKYEINNADAKAWWTFLIENYPDNYRAALKFYEDRAASEIDEGTLINDWFSDRKLPKITATREVIQVDGVTVAIYSEDGTYVFIDQKHG